MDQLDVATQSFLEAASITDEILPLLTREDLRDLLPGPDNFRKRKYIWEAVHSEQDNPPSEEAVKPAGDQNMPKTCLAQDITPEKIMKLCSPEYVLYTDPELEHVRKHYFELQCSGREHECSMSKELRCRLVRNTITSMISILRGHDLKDRRDAGEYPSREEISAMARRLIEYYPMLQQANATTKPWEPILRQMLKRLQNVKSTQTLKLATPMNNKAVVKKRRLQFQPSDKETEPDTVPVESEEMTDAPATTFTDLDSDSTDCHQSRKMMARHYKTLQELFKQQKPNKEDISHLLDLEYESRRAFVECCSDKDEERAKKVLEAYPCFSDYQHINFF
ncbi:uncharacterized protein LOC121718630 isoform X2 [Alosa sapidissima]|uniref:uncharacterized protein LOC121718630 isoform X2 n=1 Tax=Alosa sapidissima TaxID=34773 RepID=UPI001C09B61E|nr:uncharacterized protein LOC121718630 isoform X2 [Alosa sapidissima]